MYWIEIEFGEIFRKGEIEELLGIIALTQLILVPGYPYGLVIRLHSQLRKDEMETRKRFLYHYVTIKMF